MLILPVDLLVFHVVGFLLIVSFFLHAVWVAQGLLGRAGRSGRCRDGSLVAQHAQLEGQLEGVDRLNVLLEVDARIASAQVDRERQHRRIVG